MSDEQNEATVQEAASIEPLVEKPQKEAIEKQKQYYLEQSRLLCPTLSPHAPESLRLWALLRKTKHIISLLTYFHQPWEDGMPEIQKACLTFLTADNIPKKERLRCIEKWGNWTEFLLGASFHHGLVTQLLQHYHSQLYDLQQLVGWEPSPIPDITVD